MSHRIFMKNRSAWSRQLLNLFLAAAFAAWIPFILSTRASAVPSPTTWTSVNGVKAALAAYAGGEPPVATPHGIRLLSGKPNESNAVALDQTAKGRYRHVHATWSMSIGTGGEGASFVLLDTGRYGAHGAPQGFDSWDDPRLPGSFAVAFDIHDPPTDNPFDTDRNIDGNPQREVALYWDGEEITRMLSPVEFRTSTPKQIDVDLDFVCGGANVDVLIDGKPLYRQYFIPNMQPYESRALFGGRSSDVATTLEVGDINVDYSGRTGTPQPPLVVDAISAEPLDLKHNEQASDVDFPQDTKPYGRIICTLTLAKPDAGYDPWDRRASIYAVDDKGERFEIVRFITPYHRGFTWNVDVTDYRPLLEGKKKIVAACVTYSTGWLASVSFRFYPGRTDRMAYKVMHLWTGDAEIGNPEKPVSTFFTPEHVVRDPSADFVKLRFIVTGHGQAPNTGDAAEFIPLTRTVTVNGHQYTNLLWKTDNYLNACRPQGGTWKYDRAGWGPGTVVSPWDLDITREMPKGKPTEIKYAVGDYVNTSRDPGNPPVHWVESQVIYYRKAR
jgi:hypothetical protein